MREEFWDLMCSAAPLWRFAMTANMVLLVLIGISFLFLRPGSASYYLNVFTLALVLPLLGTSVYALKRCESREGR